MNPAILSAARFAGYTPVHVDANTLGEKVHLTDLVQVAEKHLKYQPGSVGVKAHAYHGAVLEGKPQPLVVIETWDKENGAIADPKALAVDVFIRNAVRENFGDAAITGDCGHSWDYDKKLQAL